MINFHLDTLKELHERFETGGELDFIGWAIHKTKKIDAIKIIQGSKSELISLDINRPLLQKNNPDWHVENSGFNKRIKISAHVPIVVYCVTQDGNVECYRVNSNKFQPILFVHIAKTAGSSVNNYLKDNISGSSYLHVESSPDWNSIHFSDEHYISGHLTYREFKNRLDTSCYLKLVTLRNPIDHLISHLSWIRKISDDADRFEAHPTYIQTLSLKLKDTDLSIPEQLHKTICSFTTQEFALLDNTQTRYLREKTGSHAVKAEDVLSAIENLQTFDVVGCSEKLDDFLAEVSRLKGWDFSGSSPQENRLSSKFGLSSKSELAEVLNPLIHYDIKLYSYFF